MVNFIRDHKNWCRTCTSFEKELRRYFHLRRLNIFQHFDLRRHWEGFLFEKDLKSMELLQSSWDGFEKVRWIWEGNVPSLLFTLLNQNCCSFYNLFYLPVVLELFRTVNFWIARSWIFASILRQTRFNHLWHNYLFSE